MKDKPNWKKGDIIALIGCNSGALSIFEAERDPYYGSPLFSSEQDWYYGLRNCKEFRLATKHDIDYKIKLQKEKLQLEQSRLDELLNFNEILENK
jgi:hypothetical protein